MTQQVNVLSIRIMDTSYEEDAIIKERLRRARLNQIKQGMKALQPGADPNELTKLQHQMIDNNAVLVGAMDLSKK
jgi:hypothetical protein